MGIAAVKANETRIRQWEPPRGLCDHEEQDQDKADSPSAGCSHVILTTKGLRSPPLPRALRRKSTSSSRSPVDASKLSPANATQATRRNITAEVHTVMGRPENLCCGLSQ